MRPGRTTVDAVARERRRLRTVMDVLTTWTAADLRRWAADARRRGRAPTWTYFQARAEVEALDSLRRAVLRQFVMQASTELDRLLLEGSKGEIELVYDPGVSPGRPGDSCGAA